MGSSPEPLVGGQTYWPRGLPARPHAARVPAPCARLGHPMTSATPPADLLEGVVRALEPALRVDRLVGATAEGVVYHAWDRVLKRHVALYAHLAPDAPGRAWFLPEPEPPAALDHPPDRHL